MDVLPWTSCILTIFGLNEVREGERKCKRVTRSLIIFLVHLIFMIGTFYSIVLVFNAKEMENYTLMAANVPYFGITVYFYHMICRNTRILLKQLRKAFRRLPKKCIEWIHRREKVFLTLQMIFMAAPGVTVIALLTQADQMGSSIFYTNATVLELCFPISCYIIVFLVLTWTSFLYIVVVDVVRICTEDVKNQIVKASEVGTSLFSHVLEGLKKNHSLIQDINETIGMVPMMSFVFLFLNVVVLTTGFVLKGMNSDVFFFVSTLCTVLNRALMTFIIVDRASSVHKVVKECISTAGTVFLKHSPGDAPFL